MMPLIQLKLVKIIGHHLQTCSNIGFHIPLHCLNISSLPPYLMTDMFNMILLEFSWNLLPPSPDEPHVDHTASPMVKIRNKTSQKLKKYKGQN